MSEKLRLVQNLIKQRKVRRATEQFVVEGPHLVFEAKKQIDFVVYADDLQLVNQLEQEKIQCIRVTKQEFAELSEVEAPQWILAVCQMKSFELDALLRHKKPLIVFCVGIQDPGNLGTIIRTADAVGANGIILSKGTVDLFNPKVIRANMGSMFHLPIVIDLPVAETIKTLQTKGLSCVATASSGEKDYFALEYGQPTAILIGNEGAGLYDDVIKLCDEVVRIPMPGKAESLNAAVSTAVVMYEALRQRTKM